MNSEGPIVKDSSAQLLDCVRAEQILRWTCCPVPMAISATDEVLQSCPQLPAGTGESKKNKTAPSWPSGASQKPQRHFMAHGKKKKLNVVHCQGEENTGRQKKMPAMQRPFDFPMRTNRIPVAGGWPTLCQSRSPSLGLDVLAGIPSNTPVANLKAYPLKSKSVRISCNNIAN